ncbi:hypothetical protein LTR56_000121 [Elasticomyces elasticus]|nr:hypothetical protein LTR56_000121 [Elasticomyces elasticus]KAK3667109.1 hypothetical protein LTR22_001973 [Elasticomyces elasticus]KAK4932884.1 hypothetical protein LTR49_000840 [Elasticomyces elasticus]KAK5768712.1 hypothetical protein LTS12_001138 [Elasticomyces elasticus]
MALTLWPGSESQPSNLHQVLELSDSNSTGTNDNSDTDSEPEMDPADQELNIPTFPLLDLPPELWLRIIQTAVQVPSPVTLTVDPWGAEHKPILSHYAPRYSRRYTQHLNAGHQPALSRVSRLLRKETLAQYYRLNDFEIVQEKFIGSNWIDEIGVGNLRNMREVSYRAVCRGSFGLRKVQFEALRGVEVEVKEAGDGRVGDGFEGVWRFVVRF